MYHRPKMHDTVRLLNKNDDIPFPNMILFWGQSLNQEGYQYQRHHSYSIKLRGLSLMFSDIHLYHN